MFGQILRKVLAIRKAYFTKIHKIGYSQFGEDIVLNEILNEQKNDGFFVDVGCYHPRKYNNTYMLYKRGWRGINIDMEEDKIRLFNMVRPQDTNVLSPVSDKQEEVTLYRYSKFGVGSTIDDQFAEQTTDKIYDKQTVQTKTLNQIIEQSPYKQRQIDVLSIDVEGMDFRVLKSLDLEIYKPKIMIVEDHHRSIGEILETDIYKYLQQNNYVLRSWTFYSLIFVLPEADILKDREKRSLDK